MPVAVPNARPKLSREELERLIEPFNVDRVKYPLLVVGIRGYYEKSLGDPTKNDRGIYDDAIFIIGPNVFLSFNANTDPSVFRAGEGTGANKGIATLKPGFYAVHQLDKHKGKYLALCQRVGTVTVLRDDKDGTPYEDTGNFGINIHKGDYNSTSSEGCQTIYPKQWEEFITTIQKVGKSLFGDNYSKRIYPYILLEQA